MATATKNQKRNRLKGKIRTKLFGTAECPRLSVFRSNTHIYAQLIDDTVSKTLLSGSDLKVKKGTNIERANTVGKEIAEAARAKGISMVVFDRNGFRYAGRVRALAESARSAGLTF